MWHYNLSPYLIEQAELILTRCERLAGAGSEAGLDAMPPEDDSTPAEDPFKAPSLEPANVAPVRLARSPRALPVITRKSKQDQRAFLDMCCTEPNSLPFAAFASDDEASIEERSFALRYLALIDVRGVS